MINLIYMNETEKYHPVEMLKEISQTMPVWLRSAIFS